MIDNILMQLIPENWTHIAAYNPFVIATLIAIVVAIGVAVKYFFIRKAPPGRRMGEVICSMQNGELFRGIVFQLEEWMQQPNLEAMREIPEAKPIIDVVLKNKDKMWLALIQLKGGLPGATLESGLAIVLSNASFFDPKYSKDIGNYFDVLRTDRVYVKKVNEALSQGTIMHNVPDILEGKTAHVIYYPMPAYGENSTKDIIENPHATIGVLAQVKSAVAGLYHTKAMEAKLHTTEKNFDMATSEVSRETGEKGFVQLQFSKKSPFPGAESIMRPALSPLILVLTIAFSVAIFPDWLKQYQPLASTIQHQLEAVGIGALIYYAIAYFRR